MTNRATHEAVYFEAFEWALPESYASAVASSRFEAGDVLYRDRDAYTDWSEEIRPGMDAIQVLAPPRSARGASVDGEGDRRQKNWSSEVQILLIDPLTGTSQERVLTQGKLLMALWHGDETWLDADRDEPSFPRTARDLHNALDATLDVWIALAKRKRIRSGSLFVLVVDLASDASRAKSAVVSERLRANGTVHVVDLTPADAGVEAAETYHPTLVLRGFLMPGQSVEAAEVALRGVLYQGGARASERSGPDNPPAPGGASPQPTDRFSIGRHGLLTALP